MKVLHKYDEKLVGETISFEITEPAVCWDGGVACCTRQDTESTLMK